MSDRVGKTLAELWPDVRVGDVFSCDWIKNPYARVELVDGSNAFAAPRKRLDGVRYCVGPDDRLVAESVSAADFAPRYWSPEPSAEACLEWLAKSRLPMEYNWGGTGKGGTRDYWRVGKTRSQPTPLAAIRAAMKAEKEEKK